MAKVTYKGMASPDSDIYNQPIQIGGHKSLPQKRVELTNPKVVYDQKKHRGELEFICTVEWTESHYHERIESYYLGRTKTKFELWCHFYDDNYGKYEWCRCLITDKAELSSEAIASELLRFIWVAESDGTSSGQFDIVTEEGLLTEDQIFAIGAEVWSKIEGKL